MPDTNREVFTALGRWGLADGERAQRWADMAGFRNVSVHEYGGVDLRIVHRALTESVGELEAFGRAVLSHLDRDAREP